ncbi:MAG: hypothetical protein QXW70_02855 [Candidatus Anstonellales archaeon]
MVKGQYFSFDAILATLILILSFSILFFYWFPLRQDVLEEEISLFAEALSLSEVLLTPGEDNWEAALSEGENVRNIRYIGFGVAQKKNRIDLAKVRAFRAFVFSNYEMGKNVLGISRNYKIEIVYGNNNIEIGRSPSPAVEEIGIARRPVYLYGNDGKIQPGVMIVYLWK